MSYKFELKNAELRIKYKTTNKDYDPDKEYTETYGDLVDKEDLDAQCAIDFSDAIAPLIYASVLENVARYEYLILEAE